jgi:hypothetical protein
MSGKISQMPPLAVSTPADKVEVLQAGENYQAGLYQPPDSEVASLGAQDKRFATLFATAINSLKTVAGTPLVPTVSGTFFLVAGADDSNGGSNAITVSAAGTYIGDLRAGGAGSANVVTADNQGLLIGQIIGTAGDTDGTNTLDLGGAGSMLVGQIEVTAASSATGQAATIQAGGGGNGAEGAMAVGKILLRAAGGTGGILAAGEGVQTAHGTMAQGYIDNNGAGEVCIRANNFGSTAVGYIQAAPATGVTIEIIASGQGALAHGVIRTAGGSISATGQGAIAFGATLNSGTILSAARGSLAGGRTSTADIHVTQGSHGSIAWGNSTSTDIIASGSNCQQFGPGTNAQDNALQQGIAGTGIAIKGTSGAFDTPANGQIYNNAGVVTVHTNGNAILLDKQAALTAVDNQATDATIATNDTITNNIRTRLNDLESRLQTLNILT